MDYEKLKQENEILKNKLLTAQIWMEREVRNQISQIAKQKLKENTNQQKQEFFSENVEELVSHRIADFFWEILLLNISGNVVDNLISAEIAYHNMQNNPSADGLSVISSYHKVFDSLIESYITKRFRKFAQKKWQKYLRKNDILEKNLHSVVTQWYILGVGKLFHLLKFIKENQELYDYGKCFVDYLEKYQHLNDILMDEHFYNQLKKLVESEVLGKKRHVWKIDFQEVTQARGLMIWNFQERKCLLYQLIASQEII